MAQTQFHYNLETFLLFLKRHKNLFSITRAQVYICLYLNVQFNVQLLLHYTQEILFAEIDIFYRIPWNNDFEKMNILHGIQSQIGLFLLSIRIIVI